MAFSPPFRLFAAIFIFLLWRSIFVVRVVAVVAGLLFSAARKLYDVSVD
jgi:hypothetical protein